MKYEIFDTTRVLVSEHALKDTTSDEQLYPLFVGREETRKSRRIVRVIA